MNKFIRSLSDIVFSGKVSEGVVLMLVIGAVVTALAVSVAMGAVSMASAAQEALAPFLSR